VRADDCDYKVVSYRRRFPRVAKKNTSMKTTPCLGIDIARLSFVAALWFEAGQFIKAEFQNHAGGFRRLRRWLQQHGVGLVPVGLESTNTYAEGLAHWLHAQGHRVYLLNPERTACYARCLGQRNKTDPADAVTIAAFVAKHAGTPWQPPSPEQKALRSLTRARQQLVECGKKLRNQLQTADTIAQAHLQSVLHSVNQQLAAIAREVAAHLKAHPRLHQQVQRLMTVKGVGLLTAAIAVAELPPITPESDPRAISAWVGLTPRRHQSGKTELPAHLSRKGNVFLRQALFMPALVAKRYNPLFQNFARNLAAKGKRPGAIVGAVSHKLLRVLVGLLRSETDFDPNWSFKKS
jgi:transposase